VADLPVEGEGDAQAPCVNTSPSLLLLGGVRAWGEWGGGGLALPISKPQRHTVSLCDWALPRPCSSTSRTETLLRGAAKLAVTLLLHFTHRDQQQTW